MDLIRARLDAVGLADKTPIDLVTALTAGLATQQRADDRGGDRYVRLLDEVVDMFHPLIGRSGRSVRGTSCGILVDVQSGSPLVNPEAHLRVPVGV